MGGQGTRACAAAGGGGPPPCGWPSPAAPPAAREPQGAVPGAATRRRRNIALAGRPRASGGAGPHPSHLWRDSASPCRLGGNQAVSWVSEKFGAFVNFHLRRRDTVLLDFRAW